MGSISCQEDATHTVMVRCELTSPPLDHVHEFALDILATNTSCIPKLAGPSIFFPEPNPRKSPETAPVQSREIGPSALRTKERISFSRWEGAVAPVAAILVNGREFAAHQQ